MTDIEQFYNNLGEAIGKLLPTYPKYTYKIISPMRRNNVLLPHKLSMHVDYTRRKIAFGFRLEIRGENDTVEVSCGDSFIIFDLYTFEPKKVVKFMKKVTKL